MSRRLLPSTVCPPPLPDPVRLFFWLCINGMPLSPTHFSATVLYPIASLSLSVLLSGCPSVSLFLSLLQVLLPLWLALLARMLLSAWLSFWLPRCLFAPLAAPTLPLQAPCWDLLLAKPRALRHHAAPEVAPAHPERARSQRTTPTLRPFDLCPFYVLSTSRVLTALKLATRTVIMRWRK